VPKLSVLDNVPVWHGSSATDSLRNSLRIAPEVERLGYTRYWISEHHNMRRLATTAPAVLIAGLASVTSTMRIGSGGVLLPNHAPLIVAEQFGTLEALHPGRIDLGLGRSVGTDPATAKRLRADGVTPDPAEFAGAIEELMSYFAGAADPSTDVAAVPAEENRPPVWLLGSSVGSAASAGALGVPYAYAHQINPRDTAAALAAYRENFRPSVYLTEPYALVAAFVFAADSDTEAERLSTPIQLGYLRVRLSGRTDPYPTMAEADAHSWTAEERDLAGALFGTQLVGSAATVRDKANELVSAAGADELMAVTLVQDNTARLRSYELLAREFLG
jgi:luciferase family oxidoreductase group 1